MDKHQGVLSNSILSVNTHFWTDNHCKACFSANVVVLFAEKYMIDDGRE